MPQTDSILARFPGPVTLYVSRRKKLFGLVFCVGFAAFFAWLLFAEYPKTRGYTSGWYSVIMTSLVVMGCGALAIRLVILLLFPAAASLTLDADGFKIGYVFQRIGASWRGVSDFRVETTYWPGRIGGALKQIMYEDLAAGAGRGGAAKVIRVLPELYGQPRLHGDELASLMNEWRRRAVSDER